MAKPPGERTKLIRQAIMDHRGMGNTALANKLNEQSPGHNIKPNDIAQQRQAMKKLGKGGAKGPKATKGGKKAEPRPDKPAASVAAVKAAPGSSGLTTDDVDDLLSLVLKVGGVDNLIRYLQLMRSIR
jgi:hypothetical protein